MQFPADIQWQWIYFSTFCLFQAVVVVKYLFQFGFFAWNNNTDIETDPFWPPRIIGIEKKSGFVTADLVLLLALFIHRSVLKVRIQLRWCKLNGKKFCICIVFGLSLVLFFFLWMNSRLNYYNCTFLNVNWKLINVVKVLKGMKNKSFKFDLNSTSVTSDYS